MRVAAPALVFAAMALGACDDMSHQPRQSDYGPAVGFAAAPAGTVRFEQQSQAVPALTATLLRRGQQRYRIFCTPCHGEQGDGRGMVVLRGFPAPPSFGDSSLPQRSTGQLVQLIGDGYGVMYGFGDRVPIEDRWAIAAYVRALQISLHSEAPR